MNATDTTATRFQRAVTRAIPGRLHTAEILVVVDELLAVLATTYPASDTGAGAHSALVAERDQLLGAIEEMRARFVGLEAERDELRATRQEMQTAYADLATERDDLQRQLATADRSDQHDGPSSSPAAPPAGHVATLTAGAWQLEHPAGCDTSCPLGPLVTKLAAPPGGAGSWDVVLIGGAARITTGEAR